jgi:hypothetical protein
MLLAAGLQGVNRLALIFQQLSIGSVAVSTVTALEAAAKYPPLVLGTSVLFFLVACKQTNSIINLSARNVAGSSNVKDQVAVASCGQNQPIPVFPSKASRLAQVLPRL